MDSRAAAERMSDGTVALLSIHPQYASAILAGSKRVELRKSPLRPETSHVAIYATRPVQKLVGVFSVGQVDVESPEVLWERYGDVAGIDRAGFDHYYEGREVGVAIGVADVTVLDSPIELTSLHETLSAPQNVVYLDEVAINRLAAHVAPRDAALTPPTPPARVATWVARHMRRGVCAAAGLVKAVHGS